MSKKAPELTWQDKAILVVIPVVVFLIFIAANYLTQDLTVGEAFRKKIPRTPIRDGGFVVALLPETTTGSAPVQLCRLRSRDGLASFTFHYNVCGSATLNLQAGRLLQFNGEYRHTPDGGIVEAPFKGKTGKWSGWVVYENRRHFHPEDPEGTSLPLAE